MNYEARNVRTFKLIALIVLFVTCRRFSINLRVIAFTATNNRINSNFKSNTVELKHNFQRKSRSCRYSTAPQNYKQIAEEIDCNDSYRGISKIAHPATNNRRELLQQAKQQASLILASLILGESTAFAQQVSANDLVEAKTIVITGANSGIGFEACKRLIVKGHTIILACRSMEKAHHAIDRIQQDIGVAMSGKLIPSECNLADLSSIQKFAADITANYKTDTLCLNAGVARNTAATDCARTKDGFELTVGVNHFGHFYLNHLMLPHLSNDGRIVVTASSVHDPESPGGAQGVPATLGTLDGLLKYGRDCEMLDGNAFNADKAYKDSKLCNVLFVRELQRRLDRNTATKQICTNSFSPGLIVGTGLFRDQNPLFTKLFDVAATNLLKVGETPEWGGACLEYMTTMSSKGLFYNSNPGSSKYGNDAFGRDFKPMDVSMEGQDDAKAQLLWDLSEKALGISA